MRAPPLLLVACILLSAQPSHQQQCSSSPAGYYYSSATSTCEPCPSGYYCPASQKIACPAGTYQPLQQAVACLPCLANFYCPGQGTVSPTACPTGRTSSAGSSSPACGDCNYASYYYSAATQTCVPRQVAPCSLDAQYEVPTPLNTTQERVCRALTVCKTSARLPSQTQIDGNPGGLAYFEPREEYIEVYNTRYADRKCWRWRPCASSTYLAQPLVEDGQGFLMQKPVCRALSAAANPSRQYLYVDGSATRDRDNVWLDCTACSRKTSASVPQGFYQASPCTPTQDAVCLPYTLCDARYQYLQRKGDAAHDNVCALKTKCTAQSQRSQYEVRPAVDSPRFAVNGTDAACANYSSTCPSGKYMSFSGDDTHDIECSPCPPGTYRDGNASTAQMSCSECPAGKFSARPGATACTPCTTNCSAGRLQQACAFSPAAQHCAPAIKEACTPKSDAVCTMCHALSRQAGYSLDPASGFCAPCKPGYYYNASDPVEGRRCVPCTPGFYCPTKDSFVECPSTIIFRRNSTYVAVPSTIPGSEPASTLEQGCSCSLAGGFETSKYSQALFGCVPCEDGYYAAPGVDAECRPCPSGKYASQTRGLRDYRRCPAPDSPVVSFAQSSMQQPQPAASCSSELTVSAGATECTPCPPDRPYTWAESAAKSIDECRRCPREHFWDAEQGLCVACNSECDTSPGSRLFEAVPCTEFSDRRCEECLWHSCNPVGEYLDEERGCPGSIDSYRPCAPCTNKPANNSQYVMPMETEGGQACTWRCNEGFYSRPGDLGPGNSLCVPCTSMTSDNCRPGHILAPCFAFLNRDASCSQACDAKLLGKPLDAVEEGDSNSEWVWTKYELVGSEPQMQLVENPTGGLDGLPNAGCMWRCKPGFVLRTLATTGTAEGVNFCVPA